jgi:hypothetical protein
MTGEPLPNARVTLLDSEGEEDIAVLSDENGIFQLKANGKFGPCQLNVFKEGYHYIYYLFDVVSLAETPEMEINLKCRAEGTPREIYMCHV